MTDTPNDPLINMLREMFSTYQALKTLGFKEPMYAPINVPIHAVQFGSTGVHLVTRREDGGWWCHEGGDLWPYHPVMWRQLP